VNKTEYEAIEEQITANGMSKVLAEFEYPLVISGIPENLHDSFRMHGFDEYAVFQDYWIDTLIPPGEQHNDYVFLRGDEYLAASKISVACKGQSRGFEGEPPVWFSDWLRGEEGLKYILKQDFNLVKTKYKST